MKIGVVLSLGLLFISLVPYSLQDPSQNTGVAAGQTWQDEYQPEEYRGEKEEETLEDQTTRRPRGKRRRRMRKRLRVKPAEDDVDRISNADQNQEVVIEKGLNEEENVTPMDLPRRRPGKRRRRPYRRYQDDDSTPAKPLRRRRKGGRKKIRPEVQDEVAQTESPPQKKDEYEAETTMQPIPTTIINHFNEHQDEEKPTETPKELSTIPSIIQTDQEVKDEANNDIKPEIEDVKPTAYGSKIFDRKKLFSNPRRTLPVTSAVIRKLGPSKSNYSDNSTPQADFSNSYAAKIIDKVLIRSNSVPESNTNLPETIKPEKLVHAESKIRTLEKVKTQETEDEEPNYPKILPRHKYRNRIKSIETTTVPQYTTTEKIETTIEPEMQNESFIAQDNKMTDSEIEKMIENWDVESFNLTNIDDFIVDLIKSKTGKDHLAKILESRNMTVSQLLEHRERGSSKFHLLEMFPQRRKQEKTTEAPTSSTSVHPPKDSQQIQFPSDDVLGSFQNFSDEIGKHKQKNQISNNNSENTNDSREPRLFDSMPEFTTLSVTSTTKSDKHPTWRIIPNPKLRPVSVRGNYEEIPISGVLNKPLEDSANDIYIVDESESIIHHKKFGSDRIKSKEPFGNFKKIPVGVKSAIIISGIILAIATFGFLSLLISCRVRQKRTILRAKQDIMCEQLQNDDFMTSQQSLSPVLTKHQQVYNPHQEHHSHPHNRHYYLWRTIRRTFRNQ